MTRISIAAPLKSVALLAGVAALAITMSQPTMAASSTTKVAAGVTAKSTGNDMTDVSAQRRRYGGGYGGAAAAAAVAGVIGTAIVASQYNRGYDYGSPYDSYAYAPGPGYYDGGPAYYGGGGYYGGRSTGYFNGNGGVPLFKGRPLASW